jgi:small redox-active disulfide protein 2
MAKDEIKQIMINDHLVGIVGLDDIIKKISATHRNKSDEDITNILLREIALNNYVPSSAHDAYGHALLREFKIAQGLLVAEEPIRGLNIAVLGVGCARCSQLENDVRDLLSEMKIAANLHHITDLKEIAHYGLLGSPALVINNKVVSVGEVPPKSKIRQWIIEAYK